jgi:sugar/nucleoside kinase (ribokinase family)
MNSTGAGDIAAGVFLSGILNNEPIKKTLSLAAYYSALVLKAYNGRFTNGREG